jgi:hypothetical protein
MMSSFFLMVAVLAGAVTVYLAERRGHPLAVGIRVNQSHGQILNLQDQHMRVAAADVVLDEELPAAARRLIGGPCSS